MFPITNSNNGSARNLGNQVLKMASKIVFDEISFIGTASGQPVNRSIIVRFVSRDTVADEVRILMNRRCKWLAPCYFQRPRDCLWLFELQQCLDSCGLVRRYIPNISQQ